MSDFWLILIGIGVVAVVFCVLFGIAIWIGHRQDRRRRERRAARRMMERAKIP